MATATLILGPRDHGRLMILDESEQADFEEGYRYELGRGILAVSPFSSRRHSQVMSNLYFAAGCYSHLHHRTILCAGGASEFLLRISQCISGRHPHFSAVLRPEPGSPDRNPQPTLAAGVVWRGSLHCDYVVKREEYLIYGLLEYWIVDFLARKLTLLVRDGDAWAKQVFTAESAIIPSVVLPGLATTLGDLWADLDFYDADEEGGLTA